MRALFWSNKTMREYSDVEFKLLLKYNPIGLLPYYVYLNESTILDNRNTILTILTAIISMSQETNYAFSKETDAFNKIFLTMDNNGYYSDEYAEMCFLLI